jgi:hypothetical protein
VCCPWQSMMRCRLADRLLLSGFVCSVGNITAMVDRVKVLFAGHPDLLRGFDRFLPRGSIPSPGSRQGAQTAGNWRLLLALLWNCEWSNERFFAHMSAKRLWLIKQPNFPLLEIVTCVCHLLGWEYHLIIRRPMFLFKICKKKIPHFSKRDGSESPVENSVSCIHISVFWRGK